MINLDKIKGNLNIKESSVLNKMQAKGEEKMYNYLSGADPDSSYTNDNVKTILNMSGKIDWSKVQDPSNALFNIGYSEQGNIIGILTNANALLQDMLLYCVLEEAKENLKEVLSIEVGKNKIYGKRYAVNGQSPLTFSLPVVTKGGYKTLAVVIHNAHADKFTKILESLDINALTEEDMLLLAKDISFISRTQELAIDVAKDKTIEIVDTSSWLNRGIKPANYWLAKQKKYTTTGWYAKENLNELIDAKKKGDLVPEFKISKDIPKKASDKVGREVVTSESIARETLLRATEDYYNNHYKSMLAYSQETELNITSKAMAIKHPELTKAMANVFVAYRSYMIDNLPNYSMIDDAETITFLRKVTKEKLEHFAEICRNTIYKLGLSSGHSYKDIAMIAYGADLTSVSKDEGKFFRAIMPEEFKKLYAQGKTATSRERLFFVDEITEDAIDEGEEVIVNFVKGQAFNKDGILIAKASFKFNANNCRIVFDENDGQFYAEQELGIGLPTFGDTVLMKARGLSEGQIEDIRENKKEVIYSPITKEEMTNTLICLDEASNEYHTLAELGNYGALTVEEQSMLINRADLTRLICDKERNIDVVSLLKDYNQVRKYKLHSKLVIDDVITVNKDNQYRADYIICSI